MSWSVLYLFSNFTCKLYESVTYHILYIKYFLVFLSFKKKKKSVQKCCLSHCVSGVSAVI